MDSVRLSGGATVSIARKAGGGDGGGAARGGKGKGKGGGKGLDILKKVDNRHGSISGQGSEFLPRYRAERIRELDRLEQLEKDDLARQEHEDFQAKRVENMAKDEAITSKKRAKREKRKAAQQKAKAEAKLAKIALEEGEEGAEKEPLGVTPEAAAAAASMGVQNPKDGCKSEYEDKKVAVQASSFTSYGLRVYEDDELGGWSHDEA